MMPSRLTVVAMLLAVAVLLPGAPARAQEKEYTEPLGIALEGFAYPYPVDFFTLNIDGQDLRMAYMDVRPAGGGGAGDRVVVLLHGKNFFGAYWENTIKALSAAGFRVIAPDQVGFGKSAKADVHYSFDLLARNTALLLDELKVKKVAVVGHSMGGMLAVRFARNVPGRVTHLVLENPIGLEDYRMKVPVTRYEELYDRELKQSAAGIRRYFKTYFVKWSDDYERWVEAPARVTLSGEYPRYAAAAARTFEMIYQQPVRHEFGLIEAPTLLVIGQSDRTYIGRGSVPSDVAKTMGQYPQLGREAAKDIPNAKLVELPKVGHIPHLEAPQKFHAALIEFLNASATGTTTKTTTTRSVDGAPQKTP
jgi:pimeloyl-ACP methyl ester carboxylesterase